MNEAEWQTRKQRIDTRLGTMKPPWKIIRYHAGLDLASLDGVAVEELPTSTAHKLTPSILARGFAGNSSPQGSTDEPTERLLERIKSKGEYHATR